MPHPLARTLLPFIELNVQQLVILGLIYDTPATMRSINRISANAKLVPATISRAADKFEQHGLACRRIDPKDKRGVLVEITAKGRRLLEALGQQ